MHEIIGIISKDESWIIDEELFHGLLVKKNGDYYTSPIERWFERKDNDWVIIWGNKKINVPSEQIEVYPDYVIIRPDNNDTFSQIVKTLYTEQYEERKEYTLRIRDTLNELITQADKSSIDSLTEFAIKKLSIPMNKLYSGGYAILFNDGRDPVGDDEFRDIMRNIKDYTLVLLDVHI